MRLTVETTVPSAIRRQRKFFAAFDAFEAVTVNDFFLGCDLFRGIYSFFTDGTNIRRFGAKILNNQQIARGKITFKVFARFRLTTGAADGFSGTTSVANAFVDGN